MTLIPVVRIPFENQAARKRLHHNVLAIALVNKLARIAWAVLHKGSRLRVRQDQ